MTASSSTSSQRDAECGMSVSWVSHWWVTYDDIRLVDFVKPVCFTRDYSRLGQVTKTLQSRTYGNCL